MIRTLSLFTLIPSFVFGQIDSPFIVPLDGMPQVILERELAPEQIRPVLNENLSPKTIYREEGCPGCKITFRVDRQTYGPWVDINGWAPSNGGGDGHCENLNEFCHQIIGCQYNGFLTLFNPLDYDLLIVSTIITGTRIRLPANSETVVSLGSSIPEYSRDCGSREEAIAFISSEYLLDQFTVIYIRCSTCEDISPNN